MTLYDLWLNIVQMLLGTITFFKDHPTVPGLIILILRQNSIRKVINKQLPRKFRDTVDVDILEIKGDLKLIKNHLGVMGEWQSNGQQNGLKRLPLSFRRQFLFLLTALRHLNIRRKNMLTTILKANLSKKLISALVSILVVSLNQKFNLNLSENTVDLILGLSLAHISLQTIIDSIKAYVSNKYMMPSTSVISSGTRNINFDPNATYTNTFTTIKAVHDGINDLLKLAKENDTVTLSAYGPLLDIIKSVEQAKPLEIVPDVPTEQVPA